MTTKAKATKPATTNTLTFRKNHPQNRCSYGVPGVPGLVVVDKRLFADGKAPKTITLDCILAAPAAKEAKEAKGESAEATA